MITVVTSKKSSLDSFISDGISVVVGTEENDMSPSCSVDCSGVVTSEFGELDDVVVIDTGVEAMSLACKAD